MNRQPGMTIEKAHRLRSLMARMATQSQFAAESLTRMGAAVVEAGKATDRQSRRYLAQRLVTVLSHPQSQERPAATTDEEGR